MDHSPSTANARCRHRWIHRVRLRAWPRSLVSGLAGITLLVSGCSGVNRVSLRTVVLDNAKYNALTQSASGQALIQSQLRYCERGADCPLLPTTVEHGAWKVTVGAP